MCEAQDNSSPVLDAGLASAFTLLALYSQYSEFLSWSNGQKGIWEG